MMKDPDIISDTGDTKLLQMEQSLNGQTQQEHQPQNQQQQLKQSLKQTLSLTEMHFKFNDNVKVLAINNQIKELHTVLRDM